MSYNDLKMWLFKNVVTKIQNKTFSSINSFLCFPSNTVAWFGLHFFQQSILLGEGIYSLSEN